RRLDAHLLEHLPDDQLDVLVVDLDALALVDLLHLADEVQLGLGRALQREQVGRVLRALVDRIPGLDQAAVRDQQARAPRQLELDRVGELVTLGPRSVGSISTFPATLASRAAPFGFRASKISTTRGRPCVMSEPATPPVWNVRIVSCVPGSPIDCAAMMPT